MNGLSRSPKGRQTEIVRVGEKSQIRTAWSAKSRSLCDSAPVLRFHVPDNEQASTVATISYTLWPLTRGVTWPGRSHG